MGYPSRCYDCGEPDETCGCPTFNNAVVCHDDIPQQHREWLLKEIAKQIRGVENCDNLRLCVLGDGVGEYRYAQAEEKGCCGSYDGALNHPDGTMYKFGYNYGH